MPGSCNEDHELVVKMEKLVNDVDRICQTINLLETPKIISTGLEVDYTRKLANKEVSFILESNVTIAINTLEIDQKNNPMTGNPIKNSVLGQQAEALSVKSTLGKNSGLGSQDLSVVEMLPNRIGYQLKSSIMRLVQILKTNNIEFSRFVC